MPKRAYSHIIAGFGSNLSTDSGKAPSITPSITAIQGGSKGFNIGIGRVTTGAVSQGQGVGSLVPGLTPASDSEKSLKKKKGKR